jgi:hypothetical protein
MKHVYAFKLLILVAIIAAQANPEVAAAAAQRDYHFDGRISREVLENYLDRSVTMAFFLVTGVVERGRGEYLHREDDIRLIRNIGAKFIGRALYRWGGESRLNEPSFWSGAKDLIGRVHAFDPEVIFQGCLFETITRDVNQVKIPAWVFNEFQQPAADRTFSYDWIKRTDPNGHLQIPISRMISCPNTTGGNYRANTRSQACPVGYSQEEAIKRIWNTVK